jgi:thiol-disulfide isomerase/thioredoxin
MSRFTIRVCGAVILCGSMAATMPARGEDRSADAILKEIDAVKVPEFNDARREDRAYIQQYLTERSDATKRRADLIAVLYRVDPDHPKLATLLPERWGALVMMVRGPGGLNAAKELTAELDQVIARSKSDERKRDAAFWKAQVVSATSPDSAAKAKAVDEFIKFAPKDERGASLLFSLTFTSRNDPAQQKALYERIVKEFPDSSQAESVRGTLRRLDAVGEPFELEFIEVSSGSEISMKGLKGKVVVIDFWATWCGPCVAEMPTMKKLYARYKDKGVEFIGISLDYKVGGLKKLQAFVKKEGISWPQYFQGDGWESKLSASWGIAAIPAVFVVDQEGKLFSVEARGKLETMIPELLDRPVPKPGGDGER